jgi:hypothetical protein
MINITIFSKDRACQLDALLRSYYKWTNAPDPSVIYTFSTEYFGEGYDKLIRRFPDVKWILQGDFKIDTLQSIDVHKLYTVFFVDDIIFKSNFDVDEVQILENPDVCCLSLRLSSVINYCYSMNIPSPPPQLDFDYTWNWRGKPGDWGYPMSVDGHIFNTRDILPLLVNLNYRNPNTLEAGIAGSPLPKPKMACLNEHVIYNIPQNLVQTEWHNRNLNGLSASILNEKYLEGEEIDIDHLASIQNNACHFEVHYKFNTSF